MNWNLKFSSDAPGAEWTSTISDANTQPVVYLHNPEGVVEVKFTFLDGSMALFTAKDTILEQAETLLSNTDADDYSDQWDKATDLLRLLPVVDRAVVAYNHELCPLHLCDEQICADDENPECAELRA